MGKIFVGITEIAGYALHLTEGFHEISQEAIAVVLYPSPYFELPKHKHSWLVIAQKIGQKASVTPKTKPVQKILWKTLLQVTKLGVLLWAISRFDTFIFTFGTSFFKWDLWILKKWNKKIIFILNGTDSRPPYLNAKFEGISTQKLYKATQKIKEKVRRIEAYATAIVSISHQGYFHEKPVFMGLAIGQPFALPNTAEPQQNFNSDPIRIFHSSTHFRLKGTEKIRSCIQNLKNKGYKIDYIEIQNTPHHEALTQMASCTIVIDQLYSDLPLSMQTIEGMALGKTVIIGGYYAEKIATDVPKEVIPPNLFILPEELEVTLETLLKTKTYQDLGQSAKNYIQTHHSKAQIAKRFLALIEGTAPKQWTYAPQKNRYLYGIGLPKDTVKIQVTRLVNHYSKGALCLSDKPELEALFLDLISK